jgi:hypothetical protein
MFAMSEREKLKDYDSEPIAYCAKCLSPKIKHEAILDTDYCGDCGCSDIKEASVYVWESMYERKHGHKYVVKGTDPKKHPIFKLSLSKLMEKLANLEQWREVIHKLYPRFPGGFSKADSIVLLFDKLVKDNKLDELRMKMLDYIKG